jgi:hypothetical protein
MSAKSTNHHFLIRFGSVCLTVLLLVSCGQSGGNGNVIVTPASSVEESTGKTDTDTGSSNAGPTESENDSATESANVAASATDSAAGTSNQGTTKTDSTTEVGKPIDLGLVNIEDGIALMSIMPEIMMASMMDQLKKFVPEGASIANWNYLQSGGRLTVDTVLPEGPENQEKFFRDQVKDASGDAPTKKDGAYRIVLKGTFEGELISMMLESTTAADGTKRTVMSLNHFREEGRMLKASDILPFTFPGSDAIADAHVNECWCLPTSKKIIYAARLTSNTKGIEYANPLKAAGFALSTTIDKYKNTTYLLNQTMGDWAIVIDICEYNEPLDFIEGGPYTTSIDIDVIPATVYK